MYSSEWEEDKQFSSKQFFEFLLEVLHCLSCILVQAAVSVKIWKGRWNWKITKKITEGRDF